MSHTDVGKLEATLHQPPRRIKDKRSCSNSGAKGPSALWNYWDQEQLDTSYLISLPHLSEVDTLSVWLGSYPLSFFAPISTVAMVIDWLAGVYSCCWFRPHGFALELWIHLSVLYSWEVTCRNSHFWCEMLVNEAKELRLSECTQTLNDMHYMTSFRRLRNQ